MNLEELLIAAFFLRAEKKVLFERLSEVLDETSDLFSFIKKYYFLYKEFPTSELVEQEMNQTLPVPSAPFEFYLQKAKDAKIHAQLLEVNNICSPFLDGENYNPQLAADKLLAHVLKLQKNISNGMVDFSESKDFLTDTLKNVYNGNTPIYKTGYDCIDNLTNGIFAGDLISVTGRLGMGKTFFMLHLANYIWKTYKIPILFVTLEMPLIRIMQRLVALNTTIPLNKILSGSLDKKDWGVYNSFMKETQSKQSTFHIYHSYKMSVEDVYAKAQSTGAKAIFVDGAYLLRLQKYMAKMDRYGIIAEELKGYTLHLNVPIIASWQLNRSSEKEKEITASNIYFSDDIGQLSSIVLAILPNTDMDKEFRRKIKILKSRDGQCGELIICWDIGEGINFSAFNNDLLKIGEFF